MFVVAKYLDIAHYYLQKVIVLNTKQKSFLENILGDYILCFIVFFKQVLIMNVINYHAF